MVMEILHLNLWVYTILYLLTERGLYGTCEISDQRSQYSLCRKTEVQGRASGWERVKKQSSYNLHSNNELLLVTPSVKLHPTLGARTFTYAAPKEWNSLPISI